MRKSKDYLVRNQDNCVNVICYLSELAQYKLRMFVQYKADLILSNVTCSRHGITRKNFSFGSKSQGVPGGSMSQVVVGLPNNSYKPITNKTCVGVRFCKLQKGCIRLATASDKVYLLLANDLWFSSGTPASSTTKTSRHDIAEIC